MSKNVLILGVGKHNFGAELMLRSILHHAPKDNTYVIEASLNSAPPELYYPLAVRPLAVLNFRGRRFTTMFSFIPSRLIKLFGLIRLKEIDLVLDASGFAYSDQWGKSAFKQLSYYKNRVDTYIMLPQAFGPFDILDEKYTNLLKTVTSVYSRDRVSMDYLKRIGIKSRCYPDFTSSFVRELVSHNSCANRTVFACVVPNVRMMDMIDSPYEKFLLDLTQSLSERGKVKIIYQSSEDKKVFEHLFPNYDCFQPRSTIEYIEVLNTAEVIFSSRYHACAIGLSIGVPVFCQGWSHKYEELYKEYEIPELLINDVKEVESLLSSNVITDMTQKINIHNIVLEKTIDELFSKLPL